MSSQDPSRAFPDLESAYRWLDSHINYENQLGSVAYSGRTFEIEGFRTRLGGLGHPERARRSIHIAGTRGKGSCALMLEALLRASGLSVATFTSPHLREYRERIRLDGEPISGPLFQKYLAAAAPAVEEGQEDSTFKTVFELLTAAFFLAARGEGVDWKVVETGLGGRLDATNALPPGPVLLTRIGLEHTRLLGDTLEAIAGEKAAILKGGGWGVAGEQAAGGKAFGVFLDRARGEGVPLGIASEICPLIWSRFTPAGMELGYRFEGEELALNLGLLGPFEAENLQSALAMLSELRRRGEIPKSDRSSIHKSLIELELKGRMERLSAPGWPDLIIDGGHCPTAAASLAGAMEAHFGVEPALAVVGMMADKDHEGFFRNLAAWPGWRGLYCYSPTSPRALQADALAERAAPFFRSVRVCASLGEALESARREAEKGYRVVATGSMYSIAATTDWVQFDGRKTTRESAGPPAALAPPGSGHP